MQRVEWINKEAGELNGIKRSKGDRFEVSDELAEQLISQRLVKDIYVEKKKEEKIEKKSKGVK